MTYLKPQSPLQDKKSGNYFYPLTTVDQVIMEDGSRLNSKLNINPSDWNQNDPNASDYIKNRTHWTEPEYETVVPLQTTTGQHPIIELGTFYDGDRFDFPEDAVFVIDGISYEVSNWFDDFGENYEKLYGDSRLSEWGEGAWINQNSHPEDVPFCAMFTWYDESIDGIFYTGASIYELYIDFPDDREHTVEVKKRAGTIYHKLDVNYLPLDEMNTGPSLPEGGEAGQVLVKNSATDGDASWSTNINGNAATATKLATAQTISLTGDVTGSASFTGNTACTITATVADNSHNHTNYLPLTGGTVTGTLTLKNTTATPAKGTILNCILGQYQNAAGNYYNIGLVDLVASAEADTTVSSGYARFGSHNGASFFTAGESGRTMPKALADAGTLSAEAAYIMADSSILMYAGCANDAASYTKAMTVAADKVTSHVPLYGAVWNDYAEYREQKEEIKPGYCVASADNGQVYKTTEKFQACDGIVSDTFGFAIGETDECKTPLAVAGRVLAYCEGDRKDYHAGDTVCAGPDGKVCKMSREEIREWPDRIIGIVSEIPEYETWGSGNIVINNRIWIKVK